jgi:hypothetical protein
VATDGAGSVVWLSWTNPDQAEMHLIAWHANTKKNRRK